MDPTKKIHLTFFLFKIFFSLPRTRGISCNQRFPSVIHNPPDTGKKGSSANQGTETKFSKNKNVGKTGCNRTK